MTYYRKSAMLPHPDEHAEITTTCNEENAQYAVVQKKQKTENVYVQGRSQRGVPQVHVHPPFKKNKKPYFLSRIICFYTNNPKCQSVYLSFYLNNYQIID